MTIRIMTVLSLALLALSCGPSVQEKPVVAPFFDLEAFFQSEIDRLDGQRHVDKRITLNGATQREQADEWLAGEQLEGFKELKINRPAWRDQYSVDSLRDASGRLAGVRYTARDAALRIREVEVDWKEGAVEEVRVMKYIKNTVVFYRQELVYRPAEGYRLKRLQKAPLLKKSDLEIEVRY